MYLDKFILPIEKEEKIVERKMAENGGMRFGYIDNAYPCGIFKPIKLKEICLGLGADEAHVRCIDSHPKNIEDMKKLFREEIEYKGLSVIIACRECIQTARRHASKK